MDDLTIFQRLELLLIPIFLIFGQFMVIFIVSIFAEEELWPLIVIPMIFGYLFSLIIAYFLHRKQYLQEFKQIEQFFRVLVIIGGILLIPILLAQFLTLMTVFLTFLVLSLIFSLISGLMTISCLVLLYRIRFIRHSSE